jgi:hypothetical protein
MHGVRSVTYFGYQLGAWVTARRSVARLPPFPKGESPSCNGTETHGVLFNLFN